MAGQSLGADAPVSSSHLNAEASPGDLRTAYPAQSLSVHLRLSLGDGPSLVSLRMDAPGGGVTVHLQADDARKLAQALEQLAAKIGRIDADRQPVAREGGAA